MCGWAPDVLVQHSSTSTGCIAAVKKEHHVELYDAGTDEFPRVEVELYTLVDFWISLHGNDISL
jgi:hypothetical protein